MSCGRECDCESEEAHDAAMEESQREFLRNPGPPPAHLTGAKLSRTLQAMQEARVRLGMVE